MTVQERDEIQRYIDDANPKGAENAIAKMQLYSKYGKYKALAAPTASLKWELQKYKDTLLKRGDTTGMFEGILSSLNELFSEFVRINEEENNVEPLSVYIFTTTAPLLSNTIPPHIYKLLDPPIHKEDYPQWLPFPKDSITIDEIMNYLSENGYVFQLIYIREMNEEDTKSLIIDIDLQLEKVIAIVDLLAVRGNNEKIAEAFAHAKVRRVITPIDSYLNNMVIDYMKQVRDKIYWKLSHDKVQRERGYDLYDSELSGRNTMITTLKRILPSRNTTKNVSNTDQNDKLKGISSRLQRL